MPSTKLKGSNLPNPTAYVSVGQGTFDFEQSEQWMRPSHADEFMAHHVQHGMQSHRHTRVDQADTTDSDDTGDARQIQRDELSTLARERDIPVTVAGGFVQNETKKIPLLVNSTADAIVVAARIVAETLPIGGTLSCIVMKRSAAGAETNLQSAAWNPEDDGVLDPLTAYTLTSWENEATRTLAANDTIYLVCTADNNAVTDWTNVNITLVMRKPNNTS